MLQLGVMAFVSERKLEKCKKHQQERENVAWATLQIERQIEDEKYRDKKLFNLKKYFPRDVVDKYEDAFKKLPDPEVWRNYKDNIEKQKAEEDYWKEIKKESERLKKEEEERRRRFREAEERRKKEEEERRRRVLLYEIREVRRKRRAKRKFLKIFWPNLCIYGPMEVVVKIAGYCGWQRKQLASRFDLFFKIIAEDVCAICFEKVPDLLFLPCRHQSVCSRCWDSFKTNRDFKWRGEAKCLMCREKITREIVHHN